MNATDEALLKRMRQSENRTVSGGKQSGDDSSGQESEETMSHSNPLATATDPAYKNSAREADTAVGDVSASRGTEKALLATGSASEVGLSAPGSGFHAQSKDQREDKSRRLSQGSSFLRGDATKNTGGVESPALMEPGSSPRTGASARGGGEGRRPGPTESKEFEGGHAVASRCRGVSSRGCTSDSAGDLSDESWSSSEEAAPPADGGIGRTAFRGLDDWAGTAPYGSDDDGGDALGASSSTRSRKVRRPTASRSSLEPATSLRSEEGPPPGRMRKGRISGSVTKPMLPRNSVPILPVGGPSVDTSIANPACNDGFKRGSSINPRGPGGRMKPREAAVAPTTQLQLNKNHALGKNNLLVKGSLRPPSAPLSPPTDLPTLENKIHRGEGDVLAGNKTPAPGGQRNGAGERWMMSELQRDQRSGRVGRGGGGGGASGDCSTGRNSKGAAEHDGTQEEVPGSEDCGSDSWVIREFQARVAAARREEAERR